MPALAPIGPDSNVVVHMAVDYETYLLRNRFGFLGGGWSEGQTLASLGLNVVHGRIAGMEGVYLATTPFLFDPDSPTGWVPEDTTSWINSSTYPYPIQILGGLDAGNPTVSVEQQPLPRRLAFANRPNPFSGGTEFLFELPQPTNVRLAVYDASGRLVRSLMNAPYPAGRFSIGWNGLDSHGTRARPGVYFGKLETSAETATRRIVLLEAGSGR
jgi:hypothetical protein